MGFFVGRYYLDNLYQGYLQTQKKELLLDMAVILYQSRFIRLSNEEATSIFYWFTSLKRYFASLFTHFFGTAGDGEASSLSFKQLQDNMNTQIRAQLWRNGRLDLRLYR